MASTPAPARHLPGFSAPAAGFEEPFAMLEACHERLQRTLALLGRLREHVRQQGADDDARQAARDVLRYFDIAAPLHHADEELHVFPLLLADAAPEMRAMVKQLQLDHVEMESDWAASRVPLQGLAEGAIQSFSASAEALFDRFAARYASHIRDEEHQAYPAALQGLEPSALGRMGQEMARRRGAF